MENIIQAITEAEAKAAEIKLSATQRAAEIVADAEQKAAETEKNAREVCKAYRATQTRLAVQEAEVQYAKVIAEKSADAKAQSEEQMKNVGGVVAKIVGRIVSGDC